MGKNSHRKSHSVLQQKEAKQNNKGSILKKAINHNFDGKSKPYGFSLVGVGFNYNFATL